MENPSQQVQNGTSISKRDTCFESVSSISGDDWTTGPYGYLALLIIPAAVLFLALTHRKKHLCGGQAKKGQPELSCLL